MIRALALAGVTALAGLAGGAASAPGAHLPPQAPGRPGAAVILLDARAPVPRAPSTGKPADADSPGPAGPGAGVARLSGRGPAAGSATPAGPPGLPGVWAQNRRLRSAAAAGRGHWSRALIAGLAGIFAALVLVAAMLLRPLTQDERGRRLVDQVDRYREPSALPVTSGDRRVARAAVGWMTGLLGSGTVEHRLGERLDVAGITRRPAEWVLLSCSACLLLAAALTLLTRNPLISILVAGVTGWLGTKLILSFRIGRRRAAFGEQLPDVLQLIASSLQSGFSLPQALDAVVREDTQPAAGEFSRALAETRIGVPVENALQQAADRMDSTDLWWTVMAIRIQRQVGGNLAEVLRTTVGTMRDRAQLRRQVRALTAEGRLSAYILIALPVLVGAWLFLTRRSYIRPLYTTSFGLVMLVGAAVLIVIGSLWMRKLVKVEA